VASVFQLAKSGAMQSQSDYLAATAVGLRRSKSQIERTTYQGYEPSTGLLKRKALSDDKPVADGVKVFNRNVRIGEPLLAMRTGEKTRLLARYQQPEQRSEIVRRARLFKSPLTVNWMAISATLDGNLFDLPFSFIPTYSAYVSPPFETPANFNQFSTLRDFNHQSDRIRLSVSGGISDTITGNINTSDTAFSVNYSSRTFAFAFQLFRDQPGSLNMEVGIDQDDGAGGTSAYNTVALVKSTGLRQPNGLYLIEVDQLDVPSNLLNINNIAKNVTVSLSYGE
jgi:hypothetical protein